MTPRILCAAQDSRPVGEGPRLKGPKDEAHYPARFGCIRGPGGCSWRTHAPSWGIRSYAAADRTGRRDAGASCDRAADGVVISPAIEKPKGARKLEEKDMAGYLLVYFKDQTQSAYFAISRDGYTFTDVNDGQPVFDGALLTEQKGGARPAHHPRARRSFLPGHDGPAHLRPARRFSDDAVGAPC